MAFLIQNTRNRDGAADGELAEILEDVERETVGGRTDAEGRRKVELLRAFFERIARTQGL